MKGERTTDLFIAFLRRARPLRRMPVAVRYLLTALIVAICFGIRYWLGSAYPYPYLLFLPAITIASFVFDRGSGFFATFLSAALALYFFVEPRGSFTPTSLGSLLSVVIFTAVGLLTSAIIEALRTTVDELAEAIESLEANRHELTSNINLLETVIEGTPDPIYIKDREGRWVLANTMLAQLIGVPKERLIGRRDRDFLPLEQAEKIESVDRVVLDTRSPLLVEEMMSVAGRGPRWFLSTKAPWFGPDGTLSGIIGLSRDIHERKMAEEEVRTANAQKELLLYDINHRVKNHLQSVMATLSISRRQVADPTAREAIQNTVTRLSVLARVYDRLQLRPGGEAVVNVQDFLEGLCADLRPSIFDLRPVALHVLVEIADIELGRAVAVGLITNEALTNALKYAFPDEREGSVTVRFVKTDDNFVLEIADDGVGADPLGERTGTGTRLIRALSAQLGGTVERLGPPGTVVRVAFPVQPLR